MPLSSVEIIILNGALGGVTPTPDSTMGLIITSPPVVAPDGLPEAQEIVLGEAKMLTSLKQATDAGLDAAFDAANGVRVYQHVKEFYDVAGEGAILYLLLLSQTISMNSALALSNGWSKKIVDYSQGSIKVLGIACNREDTWEGTTDGIVYEDNVDSLVVGHAFAEEMTSEIKPLRVLIAGESPDSCVIADAVDLKQKSNNRCAILVGSTDNSYEWSSVGLALGKLAVNPVQRKISRVKDGALPITDAYVTGRKLDDQSITPAEVGFIHDKGYVTLRQHVRKSGYYFSGDPTATSDSDDYNMIARGRVIDKATVICYDTYVDELDDDIELIEGGKMSPVVLGYLQQKIENALISQMLVTQEVSAVIVNIDKDQNVGQSNKLYVDARLRPRGYQSFINVRLGFTL